MLFEGVAAPPPLLTLPAVVLLMVLFAAPDELGDCVVLPLSPILLANPPWDRDWDPPEGFIALATSRCSGEEWRGEFDCLEYVSPFPPREEVRGETLPVCNVNGQPVIRHAY